MRVERYGTGGHVYLVLHNPTEQPTIAQVQLDQAVLGPPDFAASVQPVGQQVSIRNDGLQVSIGARDTVVVQLRRR